MSPLTLIALASAAIAALLLTAFLVWRPGLTVPIKLLLLLALGVLPIVAAGAGNLSGFEAMKQQKFCGSCHNMAPYVSDAQNLHSASTAALHSRNAHFGGQSCFTCHRDYSMYGGVITKLDGMKHVWAYYVQPSTRPLALYRPYQNEHCMRCHSTTAASYRKVPVHAEMLPNIRENGVSCIGAACHGPIHFPKNEEASR
jgi:nitrate/TMAO reductase-like tetraheme cytochrome c subunit